MSVDIQPAVNNQGKPITIEEDIEYGSAIQIIYPIVGIIFAVPIVILFFDQLDGVTVAIIMGSSIFVPHIYARRKMKKTKIKKKKLKHKIEYLEEEVRGEGRAQFLLHKLAKKYERNNIKKAEELIDKTIKAWEHEKDIVEDLEDIKSKLVEIRESPKIDSNRVNPLLDRADQIYENLRKENHDEIHERKQELHHDITELEDDIEEIELSQEFNKGKSIIQGAKTDYEDGDFYSAREKFNEATELLERVMSDTARLNIEDIRGELRDYVVASRSNRDKAQQALYGDGEPPELAEPGEEVETMDASEFGGQALETPPRREVGSELRDELPEHEVLEHIGSGGNADVHKIRLKETGEVAALKVPQWEGTLSTDVVEDFTDEAETWDKLDSHDNIVEVLNWGSAPYPWMVLEYMDGSLRETTDSLGVNEKLELLASTADALEYAHGHGVVHLDIKPENVLTSDGTPKIADWGLSQVLLTHTQTQMGLSAPYAAPEQLTDDMGKVDRQTDVYQLGVLSYEVLTGGLPFDTEKMADLQRKILEETPEPPSQVNGVLPQEVDEVVLKAMAKSKDERYDAVVLFRNALQNVNI